MGAVPESLFPDKSLTWSSIVELGPESGEGIASGAGIGFPLAAATS